MIRPRDLGGVAQRAERGRTPAAEMPQARRRVLFKALWPGRGWRRGVLPGVRTPSPFEGGLCLWNGGLSSRRFGGEEGGVEWLRDVGGGAGAAGLPLTNGGGVHQKGKDLGGGPRGGPKGGWRRLPKRLGAVTVGYKCR